MYGYVVIKKIMIQFWFCLKSSILNSNKDNVMVKWLIQPVKIESEKMDYLMDMLARADIPFDKVYPLDSQVLNADKTPYQFNDNQNYFVCGSYPLTRYVAKIKPQAVFSLEDYTFADLWTIFGRYNFVNHDAHICHTNEIDWSKEQEYFVRPLEDTKSFNGGIYSPYSLKYEGMVVLASLKSISKEHRFFIIDNEIVTGSLYKINGNLYASSIIDQGAYDFASQMKEKFNHPGYVIDIATVNDEYKIMELNCLNAAGFYEINLYKLIMAVEDYYARLE